MNYLSLNIRGVGNAGKATWVRSLKSEKKISLLLVYKNPNWLTTPWLILEAFGMPLPLTTSMSMATAELEASFASGTQVCLILQTLSNINFFFASQVEFEEKTKIFMW